VELQFGGGAVRDVAPGDRLAPGQHPAAVVEPRFDRVAGIARRQRTGRRSIERLHGQLLRFAIDETQEHEKGHHESRAHAACIL
jgi:hypothetical protein